MKCNISSYRNWFTIQQWNNKNDTDQIFIVSNRLNNTKVLLIYGKIYKILAVINLNQIINWEKSKGVFHWVSVTFDELKNTRKRKYEYSNRSGKDNITDNDEQVETEHETSKSINETELEI